jgi:hypothetical protein
MREEWREVVGVAGDVKHLALQQEPRPTFYLPYTQSGARLSAVVLRVSGDPATVTAQVRGIVLAALAAGAARVEEPSGRDPARGMILRGAP